jgi:hypothetical protein
MVVVPILKYFRCHHHPELERKSSLSKFTRRSALLVYLFLTLVALPAWENVHFWGKFQSNPPILIEPVFLTTPSPTMPPPLSWPESSSGVVVWTEKNLQLGGELLQQRHRRGIFLLRATTVPIPKLYQTAYGEKGKPHDKLIFELIESIREHSSSLPIVVVTDQTPAPALLEVIDGYVLMDFHVSNTTKAWREKIPALLTTPFEETLYLDTDMKVCHDVVPLFDVLQSSEMGFVRVVPQANEKTWNKPAFKHEYYGCFILYRKTEAVHRFFAKAQTYDVADQEAINYGFNTAFAPTPKPNIYAFPAAVSAICRTNDLILAIHGPVYTIHGVTAQCGRINSHEGSRYLRCDKETGDFQVLNYTQVHNPLPKLIAG